MKKLKRILAVLVLVVGCCCCFISCSCSTTPPDGNDQNINSGGTPSPGLVEDTYYSVTVSLTGDSDGASVVSSTGDNRHKAGTSPFYTITTKIGYGIKNININSGSYHSFSEKGYIKGSEEIQLEAISKDYTITIEIERLKPVVELSIIGTGGKVSVYNDKNSGVVDGEITSSSSRSLLGGTSPKFVVEADSGYCAYSVKVDEQVKYIYGYGQLEDIIFNQIEEGHKIEVDFRKLINDVGLTSYYKNPNWSNENEGIKLGTGEYESNNDLVLISAFEQPVPEKTKTTIQLDVGAYVDSFEIFVSEDNGDTYTKITEKPLDYSYREVSEKHLLTFEKGITEKTKIKVNTIMKRVEFILYDLDSMEQKSEPGSSYSIFYCFTPPLDMQVDQYEWKYTKATSNYDDSSVFNMMDSDIITTIKDGKYIFLDDDFINADGTKIIIGYKLKQNN